MENRDEYLALTQVERLELLEEGARRMGVAMAILEKDYWVCQTLETLFELPMLGKYLVFKGGTSLSKVYGLIDRFSEDVDVSFHREFLGFGKERDPEAVSGKEQARRIDALQSACQICVREKLLPSLLKGLQRRLENEKNWSLEISPEDPQTILFNYPQAGDNRHAYIAPFIRIEFGARSDHWPAAPQSVRSYLSELFNRAMGSALVNALAAERTFWEKATLLHAEAHRDLNKPMPSRYTRHYHDLARMAVSPVAERAIADSGLRKRVVAHKSVYFRSSWARYDLAVPESFRLLPPPERYAELERDHRSMEAMFFSKPAPLHEVLNILSALESRIRESST